MVTKHLSKACSSPCKSYLMPRIIMRLVPYMFKFEVEGVENTGLQRWDP